MLNKNLLLIIFLISIPLCISNYVGYKSIVQQRKLLIDLNTNNAKLDLTEVLGYNYNYPNITITAIPIKALISRYFLSINEYKNALQFLHQSIKHNPYLMFSEALISDVYIRMSEMDSAYYYAKKAFTKLPNNSRHFGLYVKSASALNKHEELKEAFSVVKNNGDVQNWQLYSAYLYNNKDNKVVEDQINGFFKEASIIYPKNSKIKMVKKFIDIGEESIRESIKFSDFAKKQFEQKKYNSAAINYKKSFDIDSQNTITLENLIVSYYQSKQYKKSLVYSDSFFNFYDFKSKKIEVVYSMSNYKLGKKEIACKLLKDYSINNQNALIYFNRLCK